MKKLKITWSLWLVVNMIIFPLEMGCNSNENDRNKANQHLEDPHFGKEIQQKDLQKRESIQIKIKAIDIRKPLNTKEEKPAQVPLESEISAMLIRYLQKIGYIVVVHNDKLNDDILILDCSYKYDYIRLKTVYKNSGKLFSYHSGFNSYIKLFRGTHLLHSSNFKWEADQWNNNDISNILVDRILIDVGIHGSYTEDIVDVMLENRLPEYGLFALPIFYQNFARLGEKAISRLYSIIDDPGPFTKDGQYYYMGGRKYSSKRDHALKALGYFGSDYSNYFIESYLNDNISWEFHSGLKRSLIVGLENSNHKLSQETIELLLQWYKTANDVNTGRKLEDIFRKYNVDFIKKLIWEFNTDIGSLLMLASKRGQEEEVRQMLDKGANVNYKDKDGYTPLIIASYDGHVEVVKLLVDKRANVNLKDNYDQNALCWASQQGHIEVVKLLVDKVSTLDSQDDVGGTALYWASVKGHLEIVKLLVDKGANLQLKTKKYGFTPLYTTAGSGHLEVVKLLVNNGSELEIETKKGRTAIIEASRLGQLEVVKFLLEKGANAFHKDNKGKTALDYAENKGIISLLRKK